MFKNLSEGQFEKRKNIFLGIAIFMLIMMIVVLVITLRQLSHGSENKILPFVVPVILGPLTIVPIIISNLLSKELKNRKVANEEK